MYCNSVLEFISCYVNEKYNFNDIHFNNYEMYLELKQYLENNLNDSNCLLILGDIYKYGIKVEQDINKAIELYCEAVEYGNTRGLYNIASIYYSGYMVEKDLQKAFDIYSCWTILSCYFYYLSIYVEKMEWILLIDMDKNDIICNNVDGVIR